ncbi:hypothetical protein TrLO_g9870 [Triparma laevis f. longispina]|uniref:C2H2-type domain-containing protein n=1 Tax=Triparma laevis f. longispina TaxID=1714387 RepID=A0A9W7FE00_9STRA|nr:hypothetical protein TrLO_g9870 [Triparma laevis f. longispina]
MSSFSITASTAPGTTFTSRDSLALHYKSDWHRYNLKRKENNMACVDKVTFDARVSAALALKAEKAAKAERGGADHLKGDNKSKKKADNLEKKALKEGGVGGGEEGAAAAGGGSVQADVDEDFKIDPRDNLFSMNDETCLTEEDNLERMAKLHGFFLPDKEYCVDIPGLLGYAHEKVKLGHYCLYCQKIFKTATGTMRHMVDSGHTKLRYEAGIDLEEFEVFYNFSKANEEYLGVEGGEGGEATKMEVENDDDDGSDWSDVDSDDVDYEEYEQKISAAGFNINHLGELVLPSGKTIGHRALTRYYKQRFAPTDDRTSVVAAKNNIANKFGYEEYGEAPRTSLAVKAGIAHKLPTGRDGAGVLVKNQTGGFSQLSLYRYKAMAKKARNQEDAVRKYRDRKYNNTNRMDKKGNNIMNGVSVAHAKR